MNLDSAEDRRQLAENLILVSEASIALAIQERAWACLVCVRIAALEFWAV